MLSATIEFLEYSIIPQPRPTAILVPIKDCNPNRLYFIYDGKILNFNYGVPYFVNTNKEHCIFSFSDTSVMLVMNIECTKESLIKVSELMIG